MGTRKILPLVAAASGLLVALHPSTSWLVQMPLRGIGVALTGGMEANRQHVAARNLQNIGLALAAAGDDLNRIEALAAKFPRSPEVRAAALRAATREGHGFVLVGPAKDGSKKPVSYNAERTQALIANASAGEELDPENAFFPAMKAVGLLAQQQDDAAWAELRAAAKKPRYNDYVASSVQGKLALLERVQGRTPIVPSIAVVAAELYPHFSPLRAMTLWAQEKAIASEKAGQVEEGMAVRQDILHFGLLMRRDATTLIGTYVGEAVCAIAVGSPGGVKVPELKKFLKTGESEESAKERRREQMEQAWRAWALKANHPELAAAAAENQQHMVQLRARRKQTERQSMLSMDTLMAELLLLLLVAWLIVSSAVSALSSLWRKSAVGTLPVHPLCLVAPALGSEAVGIVLMLLGASRAALNLAWIGAGFLVLGMLLPDIQTGLLAGRTGIRYKELAPVTRRTVYPVLASLLLILWSALMLGLGKQEDQWRARLNSTITHEYNESMR